MIRGRTSLVTTAGLLFVLADGGLRPATGPPKLVQSVVTAEAEAVHYFKTHKEETVKVMEKYTRGLDRKVLEEVYAVYTKLFAEDTVPRGFQPTLEVMAASDPRAASARPEEFVDLRFVDELEKSGFLDTLYNRR